MPYVITEPCVDVMERSCLEVCPVDCIYDAARMLVIQRDECIDCGACEPACPVEAIFVEEEVPDQWKAFIEINGAYVDGPEPVNQQLEHHLAAHVRRGADAG